MSLKSSARALKDNPQPLSPKAFDFAFGVPVCGIDEVGRGPLCGPVVAACAFIPSDKLNHPVWDSVNDSKKLSPQKRDYLFEIIKENCVYGLGEASANEIDVLNIHHATLLAMKRAYTQILSIPPSKPSPLESGEGLKVLPTHVGGGFRWGEHEGIALIDGKFAPAIPCQTHTVIKGDSKSLSIAAASILAKVTRDRMMMELHGQFPHYGWDTNAGYGTAAHLEGIARHGITPHHRKSFAPCRG